ncbi:hypothetical protein V6N13_029161 [Hibiscus sabdariffa]
MKPKKQPCRGNGYGLYYQQYTVETDRVRTRGDKSSEEIFTNVELWSEKVSSKVARATWKEILGVPLHCWNQVTFSRLAELWSSFEALGKNANHVLDCEKITVLITTSITSKISEVVEAEVEVGNLSFLVRVEEKGFLDQPTKIPVGVSNLKKTSEKIFHVEDSTSTTSLDSSLKSSPTKGKFR